MQPAKNIVFVWEQFGPYHLDRCNAAARAFGAQCSVIGIELAEKSAAHLWDRPPAPTEFSLVTLLPGLGSSHSKAKIFFRLLAELRHARPALCFLCHYERLEIFLIALLLRLLRVPVIAMQESKFDDKPRHLFRELGKFLFLLPYRGVMVGGQRTRSYMEFFGFGSEVIREGYDTVSMERIIAWAGCAPAPDGEAFQARHFTIIARLVAKKNLQMAVDAYEKYRAVAGATSRELHICGDGPLRALLETEVQRRALQGVRFLGAVQPERIPAVLSQSLALILPSTEEQWGLVANEAVALGVPLLLSTQCGAGDSLLRSGVNGFVYEPDNVDGLAHFMNVLGRDEQLWRRMCEKSAALCPVANSARFAEAVSFFLARFSH